METSESIEYTCSRGDARYVFTLWLAHRSAPDIVQHSSCDVVEVSETVPDLVESGHGPKNLPFVKLFAHVLCSGLHSIPAVPSSTE